MFLLTYKNNRRTIKRKRQISSYNLFDGGLLAVPFKMISRYKTMIMFI